MNIQGKNLARDSLSHKHQQDDLAEQIKNITECGEKIEQFKRLVKRISSF